MDKKPWYLLSKNQLSKEGMNPIMSKNTFYPKKLSSKSKVKAIRKKKITENDPLIKIKNYSKKMKQNDKKK